MSVDAPLVLLGGPRLIPAIDGPLSARIRQRARPQAHLYYGIDLVKFDVLLIQVLVNDDVRNLNEIRDAAAYLQVALVTLEVDELGNPFVQVVRRPIEDGHDGVLRVRAFRQRPVHELYELAEPVRRSGRELDQHVVWAGWQP